MNVNYQEILYIFMAIGSITGALSLLIWPLVYIFVGRHFDKLFKSRQDDYNVFNIKIIILAPLIRSMYYAYCITFSYTKKLDYYYRIFEGYDFKENSSNLQIIISTLFMGFLSTTTIIGIVAFGPQIIQEWFNTIKNLIT